MPNSENRMANQLNALEQLIKRFPEQEADLRAMKDQIAKGELMSGTPLKLPAKEGEAPEVTRKARQLKFLEQLQTKYPNKSQTILQIKDTLSRGNK